MKKYIYIVSMLLILSVLTISGTATIDRDKISNMRTNIDMQKVSEVIKKVDYDKLLEGELEDFPIITEDWMIGIGRADYVYHKNFNAKRAVKITPISTTSNCYAKFGKWYNTPINYVINPDNSQGLSEGLITSRISTSVETWDNATSKELFNDAYNIEYTVSSGMYDGKNVIGFGPYKNPDVIAVTSIWYNVWTKQIYEFDIRFHNVFAWGDADIDNNPYLMDIQDIATHEVGHGAGLKDLYQSRCSKVTMYGYASYRETNKRTLEDGDINGIRSIYGK